MVETITREQFDAAWDAHRPAAKEFVHTRMAKERDRKPDAVAYTQGQHNAITQVLTDVVTMLFLAQEVNTGLRQRIADLEEQATKP